MSVSAWEVIAVISVIVGLTAIVWLIIIALRKEKYTRERFAFAFLTSFVPLAVSVVASLANKETPWGAFESLVRALLRLPPHKPELIPIANHVLMVVVLAIVAYVFDRIYQNWNGAFSVRQAEMLKYHEPMPLVSEGLFEAKRILTRGAPLEVHAWSDKAGRISPIDSSARHNLTWKIQARDLLVLRNRSYDIDPQRDWHDNERCWIGRNLRTGDVVAVRCEQQAISTEEIRTFVSYVHRIAKDTATDSPAECIVAIKQSVSRGPVSVEGQAVRITDEEELLTGLVDFSDYYAAIRSRVERQKLTDSDLTLLDVYTASTCRDESGTVHEDLEVYIQDWLSESSQRQLALLGEYGQGKSTAALMLAFKLTMATSMPRIPILIELRGKSPRNLTAEDLIASWTYPYGIDPRAVMKLIYAGRVLLILEGFDEMALAGDSESRLSDFRTLWSLCREGSKILITGRPNYFLDDRELKGMLGIQKSSAAGPYCDGIYLEPFSLVQIEASLRSVPSKTRAEIVELARRDRKFFEIVSRGSLLYVVSQLWEREHLSRFADRINSAFVMDLFIKHSFRRQTQKVNDSPDFMVLSESERMYFTTGIAAFMGSSGLPNLIGAEHFERAIKELYDKLPDSVSLNVDAFAARQTRPLRDRIAGSDDPIIDICNDVRSAGILVFDQSKSGSLRFAHKSFMEFLIADAYAEHLSRGNRERSSALMSASRLKAIHLLDLPVSQIFLGEILVLKLGADGVPETGAALAKFLFDVIVVRPYGTSWFSRTMASYALMNLYAAAYGLALTQRQRPAVRLAGYLLRMTGRSPIFGPMIFLYLLVSPLMLGYSLLFGSHSHLTTHPGIGPVYGGLLGGTLAAAFLLSLSRRIQQATPNIRLWLVCCEVAGIPLEEMSAVCKSKTLLKCHKELGPIPGESSEILRAVMQVQLQAIARSRGL